MPAIMAGMVSVLSPCKSMDDVASGKARVDIIRYGLDKTQIPPVGWIGGRNMIDKLQRRRAYFGSKMW